MHISDPPLSLKEHDLSSSIIGLMTTFFFFFEFWDFENFREVLGNLSSCS